MRTYRTTKPAHSALLLGLFGVLLAAGALWVGLTSDDIVNKIGLSLMAVLLGWRAISWVVSRFGTITVLTISNESITVNAESRIDNTERQIFALSWDEIGFAKITPQSQIQFYASEASDKVLGTINVYLFEEPDEILRQFSEQLGQPELIT